jgi:branched-chain amino acid transport system ATP-binding protein
LSTPTPDILSIKALSLRFGGIQALTDVSFSIHTGQVTALVGPNGSGKTSLMNCICNFYQPNSGDIWFFDKKITHIFTENIARLGITRTFQHMGLMKTQTVLENVLLGRHRQHGQIQWWQVALGQRQWHNQQQQHRAYAQMVLEHLGIAGHRHSLVGSLSYGTQKLVELARALAGEPVLLLLDEPCAGLSMAQTAQVQALITGLYRDFGCTTVLIEHDLATVRAVATTVVALEAGKVLTIGSSDEVLRHQAVILAYSG